MLDIIKKRSKYLGDMLGISLKKLQQVQILTYRRCEDKKF